jgi:hypothetical protein
MTVIAAFVGAVIFVSLISGIDKKDKQLSEMKRELSKLKWDKHSKEFSITCLETQLLCKDMLIDLHKIKLDKQSDVSEITG